MGWGSKLAMLVLVQALTLVMVMHERAVPGISCTQYRGSVHEHCSRCKGGQYGVAARIVVGAVAVGLATLLPADA